MSKKSNSFSDLIVYQIYPRSFCDSNGDGVGDLRGILQKIDHLVSLGINAVWLCPCYPSPNADNGYDVSDYQNVSPEFGTLDDWKRLKTALHDKGIKLIMDLVANHTSTEHFWFQQARTARDNPYHDYYIWANTPPNDWKSVFGGSAWEYNPQTDEYYLHSFDVKQADLNWNNPAVRKAMQSVVDFWIELGVDGFRCDVLDYTAKDLNKGIMFGGKQLPAYIRELFGRKNCAHLFTVGECQAKEDTVSLISGGFGKLTTTFQFDHITLGGDKYDPPVFAFNDLKTTVSKWQTYAQNHGLFPALFTDNHDYPMFISRYGNDGKYRYQSATMYAAMFFLLRGIPFLFQSQEYGVPNARYSNISKFNDVESHNYYQSRVELSPTNRLSAVNRGSRDNPRRPFSWNGNKTLGYGFSTAKPWLPYHSRAGEINLEKDKSAKRSVFRFYQKLLSLRKTNPVFQNGSFRELPQTDTAFIYERAVNGTRAVVVCNANKAQRISIAQTLKNERFTLVLTNYATRNQNPYSTLFRAFETAVYIQSK